ncbi:MAG: hypothetical protein B1H03_02275 [Planctomycetales bacterium 4484_113]|nr:MAG: hypothetical protein B1H03_02275 [Planctomycetales bacterium 4484_113]
MAAVLALLGLGAGLALPSAIIPQPVVLLPLMLVLLDVAVSAVLARRERRSFNGIVQFVVLVVSVGVLFLISVLSGLKPELVVLLPLVVREVMLLSRFF